MSAERTNDIESRFTFHPATTVTGPLHDAVRNSLRTEAHFLAGMMPSCREASLALTHLEEAMFWANAAIARHTPATEPAPAQNAV